MQIISFSVCLTDLDKAKITKAKNGKQYYQFNSTVFDNVDQYGNNVSITEPQTKEQRDANEPKKYLGNGKVLFESQSKVQQPTSPQQRQEFSDDSDALPY